MSQYFINDDSLKSEYRNIVYKYKDNTINFKSDLGIFSKDKIDFGSKILVESYLEHAKKNISILDVGCGYGFIGIVIAKLTNSLVDMIDVNKRAVHLSNLNIKSNKVNANSFVSDVYESVEKEYDVIITNPPIRAGKKIYMSMIIEAEKHLKSNGELWFVINKSQGAQSITGLIENVYNVNIIKKEKGFFVFFCKKR